MSTVFINLRIDEDLNDQLIEITQEEGRSKNKQIEHIFKEYVKRYGQVNGDITINQNYNNKAEVNLNK